MLFPEIIAKHCFISNGYLNISASGAVKLCEQGAVILDVREEYHTAYKKFGVPRVLLIPLSLIKEKLNDIPRDISVIVADASGLRSREAMELLIEKGHSNVINLAGGMVEWERDGFPLNSNTEEKLTGSCMCQLRPRAKKQNSDT